MIFHDIPIFFILFPDFFLILPGFPTNKNIQKPAKPPCYPPRPSCLEAQLTRGFLGRLRGMLQEGIIDEEPRYVAKRSVEDLILVPLYQKAIKAKINKHI
jgi:hypothetical protein